MNNYDILKFKLMKIFKYILLIFFPILLNASVGTGINFKYETDSLNLFVVSPYMKLDTCGISIVFKPQIKFLDTTLPPKQLFKGVVGMNMTKGYMSYNGNMFFAGAGKSSIRWGEGISPLLFSGYLPVNNLIYGFKYGIVKMTCAYLVLNKMYTTQNDVVGDTSTIKYRFNRFVVAHSMEFSVNKTRITLSEAALIYYKDGKTFPLQFLNPLNILYVLQWNDPDEGSTIPTNLFWDLSVSKELKYGKLYMELLIDDFQYNNPPGDMNEPDHLAFTIGDSLEIWGIGVKTEYSLATRWTYGLYAPAGRFEAYGFSLGTEEGDDFDRLYLGINKNIGRVDLYLNGFFKRKGEGNIDAQWPSGGGFRDEEFPANNFLSGKVKHYLCQRIGFGYRISNSYLNIEAGDLYLMGGGNMLTLKAELGYGF